MLPIAVIAVAGSTGTGAIDRIDAIADVAVRHGVWLHVDGAYGLPAAALPELQDAFLGLERADSLIVDSHKWLGTPVGCGATYVRDGGLLHRAFRQEPAPYLEAQTPTEAPSQFDDQGALWYEQTIELTAPSRGVWVWASIREIGLEGMRTRLRRHIDLARHVADLATADPRLELLLQAELSICCFRYRPPIEGDAHVDALDEEIVRRLRAETAFVPSMTVVDGALAIRPCFVNAGTTLADVEGRVNAVVEIGDRPCAPGSGGGEHDGRIMTGESVVSGE